MKITRTSKLKSLLAAFSFAFIAPFAFSGCESTNGGSTGGTHNMGNAKKPHLMSNEEMPDRR